MPDHVTLAHDNTKSGSWEPVTRSVPTINMDDHNSLLEAFELAILEGDSDMARHIAALIDHLYDHPRTDKQSAKASVDSSNLSDHTQKMNEFSRDELNAKLETIEVKMDARVESVSSKIDGFLSAQSERDKRLDAALAQISKDHGETKAGISSMKTTLLVTAVTTVIAIVLGIAGFNTALTSNMLSAFQAGKTEQSAPSTAPAVSPTQPSSPSTAPKS